MRRFVLRQEAAGLLLHDIRMSIPMLSAIYRLGTKLTGNQLNSGPRRGVAF